MATSDDKNTNLLNDELSQSRIGITLRGTAKSEEIKGTSRNDVLDGGAGSDTVDAGSGNDLLIYRLSENTGARDRYDGGSGVDTLRLEFTAAEWARADVRADITRFLTVLQKVTVRGEESEGNSEWFNFKAFGLEVRKIELLEIRVDGVVVDPLGNTTPAPVANADIANVAEGAAVSGNVLANDQATNATVSLVSNVTRGTLVLNANGSYTFTAGPAFDVLANGQSTTETFTYRITDAQGRTATAGVTITVTGTNDAAIITGTSTASLTETNAAQSTSGQLNVSDVDGAASFIAQSATAGQYGSFSIDSTGAWTYTMGSAHDEFVAGQTYSDSFTVATADGTTQVVTVNIAGSNDAAVISGFFTGSIETDAPLTITGKLDVTDIDGPDEFVAQSGIAGVNGRGSFAIDTTGNWTFIANSAFNELAVGQYLIDYAEVSAADGTKQLISITINGSNDGPVISGGMISGAVTEDTALTASGQLTANDADAGATQTWSVQGTATGVYGSFAVDQAGQWTYTLDNANHQDLAAGESHVETFTVRVTDEHGAYADQAVSVTVNGSNDEAVISGFFTGSIETDAPLTITGKLDVSDIDGPDEFIAQSGIAGINGLGSFAIDTAGNWVFNANSAFNELAVGQYIYDYAEVSTADGTRLYLSITINGTNDGAVITGDSTASITESNVAQTASGQLSVSDIDSPETVVAQTGAAGQYGSFSIDATGAWTYTMGSAHDEFATGQTYSDSFTVATADGTTQLVTVNIAGSNDAAIITGTSTASLSETNAVQSASGQLNVTDVDSAASFVAQTGAAGQYGSFSIDATGAWTYTMGSAHDEFVAGQTYSDSFTVATADGTTQVVTVTINGTNDSPVITGATQNGALTEDVADIATGQLTATDPDTGARQFWTVEGGTPAGNADFLFKADSLTITRNGATIFQDSFNDGIAPPVGPDGVTESYVGVGSVQLTESGGKLLLDSDGAQSFVGIANSDPQVGVNAIARTNIIPAITNSGLKSTANFTASAVFDLILPDSPRESYGLRFTDRVVGGNGTPPNQLGDNVVDFRVSMREDRSLVVRLQQLSFVADTKQLLEAVALTPPAGADQIRLNLAHATAHVGQVVASFDYLAAGSVVGSYNFTATGTIFEGENFTRAEIIASAPAINDSAIGGTYGTLNVDQTGTWTYTLNDGLATTQSLAAGQTAFDTFTLKVTDENGASDSETVTITVTGTNDTPEVQTGTVSRSLAEDAAASLTASGAGQFADVDLTDTHTVAAVLTSAGLNNSATLPAGLQALLADAVAVTLPDVATGDAHGQYLWDFALANSAVQFLAAGQTLTLAYDITVTDNHGAAATQRVNVTITGANDGAVITGDSTASLTETNAPLSASGNLSASDVDSSAAFVAQTNVSGSNGYGVFSIDSAGAWTYSAAAHNEFVGGQSYTDSVTVATGDGTQQVITVTITGTNDAAVITGSSTASLTETNAPLSASGTLNATDVDSSAAFVAQTNVSGSNGYGVFSIDSAGAWTYSAAAHNEFVGGQSYTDSVTVATAGGTQQVITVTITGTNDAAVITGSSTASLTETNAPLSVSGNLSASDVDSSAAFVAQTNVTGSNGYGVFSIDSAGAWTYSAAAHNEFVGGQNYTDNVTVATADGAQQVITVTITGTNDAAVITSAATAIVAENTTGTVYTAAATDVDGLTADLRYTIGGSDAALFNIDASTGAVSFKNAPNYEAPADAGGNNIYDITVSASDGVNTSAAQAVTISVTNVNEAPLITSAATASFAENATGTIYTATANDGDAGATLTYALDGTDAALFNIDASTGAVSFKNAPNYEAPADAGGDNVYDITVSASDGVNSTAAQAVAISVTDVVESLAGQSVIDLGSYGKLIAPVQVDGGKWYYYWDRSGNGTFANTGALNGGVDFTAHDVLDGIFTKDINGVVGGGGNTTDTYRYAMLNGVQVALPTALGLPSPAYLAIGGSSNHVGTRLGSSPAEAGSNAVNAAYDDLLAVWDAYNGTGFFSLRPDLARSGGTPLGWWAAGYWSATPSHSGHASVDLSTGIVADGVESTRYYVALQVLASPVITSGVAASFAENGAGVVYTVMATDTDSTALNYTIGGTDAALFNINASTGAVSFKNAPNYEAPADAGGNNVYDITVSASDGVNSSAAQAVAISVTDVAEYVSPAGQSVIDLGSYGKLIAPVQVDGGKWYYYWDRSGDGTSTLNGGVDYTSHDVLDGIFNQDINGVVGGGGNTTDTYRYATLNGVQVALPTAGGQSSPPYGSGGINNLQPGTTVGTSPATTGSNAVNATYNDLLAVWDAYNGEGTGIAFTGTGIHVNGTPSGWQAGAYWSATPSASGHTGVFLNEGYVIDSIDSPNSFVALQVL